MSSRLTNITENAKGFENEELTCLTPSRLTCISAPLHLFPTPPTSSPLIPLPTHPPHPPLDPFMHSTPCLLVHPDSPPLTPPAPPPPLRPPTSRWFLQQLWSHLLALPHASQLRTDVWLLLPPGIRHGNRSPRGSCHLVPAAQLCLLVSVTSVGRRLMMCSDKCHLSSVTSDCVSSDECHQSWVMPDH